MIEIDLQSDGKYSLNMMGKKIDTENKSLQNHFLLTPMSVKSLLKIISHLQYYRGIKNKKRKEIPHFQEHICSAGDENSEIIQYRAKNCSKVLPSNTSNASSYSACKNCKKLNKKPKESKSECDLQMTDDSNTHHEHTTQNDEIMLEQSDHNDLSTILKTIFPECSLKMQTFLMNQKLALERNPNGRRWSQEMLGCV